MAENQYRGGRGFNSGHSRSELLLGLAQSAGEITTEETLNELHEQDILWEDKDAQQIGFESDSFLRMNSRKPSWNNISPHGRQRLGESAPVNVPNWPRTIMKTSESLSDDEDEDEDEMVWNPPHEFIAHNNNNRDKSFSVVEGFGRTLKGRDLRKLRDAVFRQTGFVD